MAVQPGPDDLSQLVNDVFHAVSDNDPQVIQDLLAPLPPAVARDVLHRRIVYRGLEMTPLIAAAYFGHADLVDFFIDKWDVDVKQEVTWDEGEYNVLLCAVCCNHCHIVELLLRKGWDISPNSIDGLDAVFIASRRNHLGVLKYLVEHGARVDHPSELLVPLQEALGNENREMMKYLLSKGANPNLKYRDGITGLHLAVVRQELDIIRLFLQHGARLFKDNKGRSPLMLAAMTSSTDAVEVFLEFADLSQLERVEALELLGATLAETDVNAAFQYLRQAMEERHRNPNAVLQKPDSPLPSHFHAQESKTLEELQAKQTDQHKFQLECLAIFSRILGPKNKYVLDRLNDYSRELESASRHREALAVRMHGLKTAMKLDCCTCSIVIQLNELAFTFLQTPKDESNSFFSELEEALAITLEGMEANNKLMRHLSAEQESWLTYILLALKAVQSQEEGDRLRRLVERFVRLTLGFPVLGTAVLLKWSGYDCMKDMDDLPYDLLVHFLLLCGADVHCTEVNKDTALHDVARMSSNCSDCELIGRISKILLNAGALLGMRNIAGLTPLELAAPWLEAELRRLHPLSLQSLAASVVVDHKIPYGTEVPQQLKEFIEKH